MNYVLTLGVLVLLIEAACMPAAELTVATNGRSNYKIVVPNDKTPAIDYAAAELRRFLQDISGAKYEIAIESQAGSGPAFLIGPSKRVQNSLIATAKKLTGDGVLIRTVGEDVVLLGGNDRGQLYSVYTFLEKYLGCRFFAKDCTVTPKRNPLILSSVEGSAIEAKC